MCLNHLLAFLTSLYYYHPQPISKPYSKVLETAAHTSTPQFSPVCQQENHCLPEVLPSFQILGCTEIIYFTVYSSSFMLWLDL